MKILTNTINDVKAIISKQLALYLMNHGFEVIDIQPSFKREGYFVFLFNRSPELEKAMNDYSNKTKYKR